MAISVSPTQFFPLLPNLQQNFRLHSHFSNRTFQFSNEEEQLSNPQFSAEPTEKDDKTTKKKNKKKKLRPSFYEQTIERWSVKISSPRSKFPWQDQKPANQVSGLPHQHNCFENSNNTHLDVKREYRNLEKNFEFNVENVGKLDSLVVRRGTAPWVHGRESFKFNEEDENEKNRLDFKSNTGQLNADDVERCSFDENVSSWDDILSQNLRNDVSSVSWIVDGVSTETSQLNDNVKGRRNFHENVSFLNNTLSHDLRNDVSSVRLIVAELKNSIDQNVDDIDNVVKSNSSHDISKLTGPVELPWERKGDSSDGEMLRKRSNTELAEKTIPEHELKRLRNVALRMKERVKVGPAGVTDSLVESIHKKWRVDEVVKLRFEGAPTLHMKKTHEILERKTGGIVIWRSGSSVVLYRGITYKLPCVQSYTKPADINSKHKTFTSSEAYTNKTATNTSNNFDKDSSFSNSSQKSAESFNIDEFMDQLGPRYKDWSGTKPLPIDADLLPGIIPGYTPPFRLLPYKTRLGLKDRQMTSLRWLARTISPHFALGRNRQHQGLARAMVKLWEKSTIAKIAIKRGVPNTSNERMAEEIKKLTGGVLLSRNKEYIVFYRGNDYVIPSIREALIEKQKLVATHQDDEEVARLKASDIIVSNSKIVKGPLLAGTLAETLEASTRFGQPPSTEERENMKRDLAWSKHASLVMFLERKLAFAKAKVRKAERALAKVQEFLEPAELPTDLETVTDEERALFRNMGLKLRAYLTLGRRGVFSGTVENMHLNWKNKELVKILVKGKNFAQVKHIAISLEAESGGVLISLDKTTKGYAIIVYRGKNYQRPLTLKPKNLLTKRQALARAIELQRREALNHHILNLLERIQMLKSQLNEMEADEGLHTESLDIDNDETFSSADDTGDEDEEAYLETYSSSSEDGDDTWIEEC